MSLLPLWSFQGQVNIVLSIQLSTRSQTKTTRTTPLMQITSTILLSFYGRKRFRMQICKVQQIFQIATWLRAGHIKVTCSTEGSSTFSSQYLILSNFHSDFYKSGLFARSAQLCEGKFFQRMLNTFCLETHEEIRTRDYGFLLQAVHLFK